MLFNLAELAEVLRGPGRVLDRVFSRGPSTLDQMTENDRAIAELEQMGYGKFSPEVVDVKMQNPMMYAMGTGPIQSVSRRGLFDLFRSQKAPTIIKPTPPPTLDLSPTSIVFDPVPTTPPTSNLPAVVDPEMFRAAQSGSGRAIEALSKQLGANPSDQQALAEILRRAEGFVNPELNRRQLLQSLAGAVARKVVGVSPLDVLKESVTPPKIIEPEKVDLPLRTSNVWYTTRLLNSPFGSAKLTLVTKDGRATVGVDSIESRPNSKVLSGKNLRKVLEDNGIFTEGSLGRQNYGRGRHWYNVKLKEESLPSEPSDVWDRHSSEMIKGDPNILGKHGQVWVGTTETSDGTIIEVRPFLSAKTGTEEFVEYLYNLLTKNGYNVKLPLEYIPGGEYEMDEYSGVLSDPERLTGVE